MQDFHFVMRLNKASPSLMKACATGQHIKMATLTARKAGKDQQEYLTFKFYDVLVSSFQTGGSEGADVSPTDSVSLNFAKIEVEYKPQKAGRHARRGHPVQVRPEDEQDLLAGLDPRRAGASPRSPAACAPRRRRAPRRRTRASSSRARCAKPGTTRSGSRSASRPATSCSRGSPELPSYLRRLGDADELAVLLRLFLLGVPVARDAVRRRSSAQSFDRSSQAPGCSSQPTTSSTELHASSRTTSC